MEPRDSEPWAQLPELPDVDEEQRAGGQAKVDVLQRYEQLRNFGLTPAAAARAANRGAPAYAQLPDLHRWPTVRLRAAARQHELDGYRQMSRGELIDALARRMLPSQFDVRSAPTYELAP